MKHIENITINSEIAEQLGAPIKEDNAPKEHILLNNTPILHEDPVYKPAAHPFKEARRKARMRGDTL